MNLSKDMKRFNKQLEREEYWKNFGNFTIAIILFFVFLAGIVSWACFV